MLKRKIASLLLMAALALGTLTACGGGEGGTGGAGGTGGTGGTDAGTEASPAASP